jgi:hypothetical protein
MATMKKWLYTTQALFYLPHRLVSTQCFNFVGFMRSSETHPPKKNIRREQVLVIADSCFEMFSIQELRRPQSIVHEVAVSFSDSTEEEVREAISLALSWRRMFHQSARFVH